MRIAMRSTKQIGIGVVCALISKFGFTQQLRLGKNPYTVEKSAVLELVSDNQGLLLPRIADTTSINTMSPPDGMIIYYSPSKRLLIRSNGYWKVVAETGSVVTSLNGNTGALTMDTGYISSFYSKVRSLFSATAPITYSNGTIGITQAGSSSNGYLSSTDWNTFNNKQGSGNYLVDPGGNGILARTALNTTTNRTITGTSNRISITNGDGVSGNPTVDISSSYVGQNTITTLGTITTGTWNGTKISEAYGGTNQSTYTLGDLLYASAANTLSKLEGNTTTTKKFLSQTGDGTNSAAPAWSTLSSSDIPDISATYLTRSNNLSDVSSAATARTNLGATTVGGNIFTLTNPSAISFIRINADNSVTARSAANFKTDLSLNNVENTALSTWAGSTNLTTLGTITTGTWNGTTIGITNGGTGQTTANAAFNALVPSQTGNSGKFLTTDGTNTSWAAAVNTTMISSDVINNNGTANTIADVTGLSFSVTSGNTYKFKFVIAYTAAATTTGSRWSINGPATTFLYYYSNYSLTTTTITNNQGLSSYDVPAASNATSATTGSNIAIIEGVIKPSANGTVIARFASEVSASAITAKTGSYVEYKQIN
jgi:hypothetical protein